MKVILKKKYEGLGDIGEIVNVKTGFGHNYLIPHGIASSANAKNLQLFEQEKTRIAAAANREASDALELKAKLDTISVTAEVQVGEEDRIFGSVTTQNIADLLKEKGHDIDKRKVLLEEPLKALGVYEVGIKLHPDVEAQIKVWVVKQD